MRLLWHFLSAISLHLRLGINRPVSSLRAAVLARGPCELTLLFLLLVFWSWFPIGGCGIRTVLLFVSYLVVFVLRVGQMHIGSRTTTSPIATGKHLLPFHFIQTFGWYLFSAWWFSEIYKWSRPLSAELEWVKLGRYVWIYCDLWTQSNIRTSTDPTNARA